MSETEYEEVARSEDLEDAEGDFDLGEGLLWDHA